MRGIIKEDTGPGEPNARLGTDENPHQGNEDSNLLQLLARAFITWWNRGKNLDSRSQVNAKLESKTVQVQEITEEGDFLHIADHIRIQKQVGKFAAKIFGLSVDNDGNTSIPFQLIFSVFLPMLIAIKLCPTPVILAYQTYSPLVLFDCDLTQSKARYRMV